MKSGGACSATDHPAYLSLPPRSAGLGAQTNLLSDPIMARKKKKNKSAATQAAASRGVVGPDYIQVLTSSGKIAGRSVSLILCGESHRDAIDVTRANGGEEKLGWQSTGRFDFVAEVMGKYYFDDAIRLRCGICKRSNKPLPLGKAKEWGNELGKQEIEYIEPGHEMILLWVPLEDGKKGRAYLAELFVDTFNDDDRSRTHVPQDVVRELETLDDLVLRLRTIKTSSKGLKAAASEKLRQDFEGVEEGRQMFIWADLDSEARDLNHRRILGEEISNDAYDSLIRGRKVKRQKDENLWTFDDWFSEVRSKEKSPSCHLILEGPILPDSVELNNYSGQLDYTEAADIVRCVSEDSDCSDVDLHDASFDGMGSYLDFVFRRFLHEETGDDGDFLHCVDPRDLGCVKSCVCDTLHRRWLELLHPDETEKLSNGDRRDPHFNLCNNPEVAKFRSMRDGGELELLEEELDPEDESDPKQEEMITIPSFEGFFGQGTDIMYYSPHCKISYATFLSTCVKSPENWNAFFNELFFGGEIESALSMLDLTEHTLPYSHLRSPILQHWNGEGYSWKERNDDECEITMPLFPFKRHLKAKNSPTTWTSQLYSSIMESEDAVLRELATSCKGMIMEDIRRQSMDPKNADDEFGGDWFLAYLRQCHRDVYDDIDHTDPVELLKKTSAQSISGQSKHKIGNISIPSMVAGFDIINQEMENVAPEKLRLSNQAEVLAKIIIDVYAQRLVDFAALMKVLHIIRDSETDNVAIFLYAGTCHTRVVSEFFSKHGFKRKCFAGKQDWEEDDARVLHLPAELWNLNMLFSK